MYHGISGTLIPAGFLADQFSRDFEAELAAARRALPLTRVAQWWRRTSRQLGPASGARTVLDLAVLPLLEILGYEVLRLEPSEGGFTGVVGRDDTPLALLVSLPWGGRPDQAMRDAARAARMVSTRWSIVCSGSELQIVQASRPWAQRSLRFDLARVVNNEGATHVLWALTRAAALDSFLEAVIERADRHAVQVCRSLGDGVLSSLAALVGAFGDSAIARREDPARAVEQSLTLIYRVLFLLFAEARAVVPTWHRVYRNAYTIDALCRRSSERARPKGLWQALQAISRLAHAGCCAGDLQVTAFNGRLFSPHHTPLGERLRIPDAVVKDAVLALATRHTAFGRRRIAYADLGVEQLGAVYERVLEYEVQRHNGPLVLTRTSLERKATGSFYTPRSITEFLVRRTLHPLVHGRTSDQILALRVVDPAMGSGAFVVAACRFLAAAAERAHLHSGEWTPEDVTAERRAALRRTVAQRCVYGVDLNPTAVQLARLSLWLTTLTADRPLTFLDHHLASGDSLIGASFEDIARQPPARFAPRRTPVSALPLFEDASAGDMATRVLPARVRIAEEQADTIAAVREKERELSDLVARGAPLQRWKAAADLWCAGWFWPRRALTPAAYNDLLAALLQRNPSLSQRHAACLLDDAHAIAERRRAFHWHLEFPEVFFDRDGRRRHDGGFDAVLGNPPWDVLRVDGINKSDRHVRHREQRDTLAFFRSSGIYPLQCGGHANRYQLFVERALQLVRPGGRLGLILPSGVTTDHGSGRLRRALLDTMQIDRVLGFSNRDGIFPIHRDMRFVLLTGTRDGVTDRLPCRFGLRDPAWLDTLPDAATDDPPDARPIVLSRSLLERWDHEHLTIPELESAKDLDILLQVTATIPALGGDVGWGVRFGRELNATDDKHHFRPRDRDPTALPVIEGKHLEPFRALVANSSIEISSSVAARLLDEATTFGRPRIAYRDVASATNRVTLIVAILPARTVSTHTVFCSKTSLGAASQYCLLALLNSFVANYLIRLQVTTHVTAARMTRLPVPRPDGQSIEFYALANLARRLEKTGIDGDVDTYAELNAVAARLYGLREDQYAHVLSTFPLIPSDIRDRCFHAFRKLKRS